MQELEGFESHRNERFSEKLQDEWTETQIPSSEKLKRFMRLETWFSIRQEVQRDQSH
jgi:hypothetical protein